MNEPKTVKEKFAVPPTTTHLTRTESLMIGPWFTPGGRLASASGCIGLVGAYCWSQDPTNRCAPPFPFAWVKETKSSQFVPSTLYWRYTLRVSVTAAAAAVTESWKSADVMTSKWRLAPRTTFPLRPGVMLAWVVRVTGALATSLLSYGM